MFFDKKKDIGTAIMTPDGPKDAPADPDEHLHIIAEDLVSAVKAGDVKGATEALKAFWTCMSEQDLYSDEADQT